MIVGILLDGKLAPVPVALYTGLDSDELEVIETCAGLVALLPAVVFLDDAPPEFLVQLLAHQPGTRPERGLVRLDRHLHTV